MKLTTIKPTILSAVGTHGQGQIVCSYDTLVALFGEPNAESDGYKTSAEWCLETPFGIATIYDYKECKTYCGENDGLEPEDITTWHIGGASKAVYFLISTAVESFQ